jgi:3-carboxy-cis,cis-muconate cycloisomerase
VHWGSTSQDVLDTAMVLVTREALRLVDGELDPGAPPAGPGATTGHAGAGAHPDATGAGHQPGLQVRRAAPLVRSRAQLQALAERALQLQLGGAVGTLAVLGEKGPAVAARMAAASA